MVLPVDPGAVELVGESPVLAPGSPGLKSQLCGQSRPSEPQSCHLYDGKSKTSSTGLLPGSEGLSTAVMWVPQGLARSHTYSAVSGYNDANECYLYCHRKIV